MDCKKDLPDVIAESEDLKTPKKVKKVKKSKGKKEKELVEEEISMKKEKKALFTPSTSSSKLSPE